MSTIRPIIDSAIAASEVRNRFVQDASTNWRLQLSDPGGVNRMAESIGQSVAHVVTAHHAAIHKQMTETHTAVRGVLAAATRTGSVMREFSQRATVMQKELEAALRPAALAVVEWQTFLQERTERQRIVAVALHRDGWWAAPSWPVSRAGRLVALRREKGKIALDRRICEIYRARQHGELRDMVASWMAYPEFRRRRRIIETALDLHVEGIYVASIPTLLPQVEGVAFDAFGPALNPKSVDVTSLCKTKAGAIEFHGLLADGFETALDLLYGFTAFDQVRPRSRKLNRHAISHGRTIGYGHEANSLRVFLALDQLAFVIERARERDAEGKAA